MFEPFGSLQMMAMGQVFKAVSVVSPVLNILPLEEMIDTVSQVTDLFQGKLLEKF